MPPLPSGRHSAVKVRKILYVTDGSTITMLQHEYGITISTVKPWSERIDLDGIWDQIPTLLKPIGLTRFAY